MDKITFEMDRQTHLRVSKYGERMSRARRRRSGRRRVGRRRRRRMERTRMRGRTRMRRGDWGGGGGVRDPPCLPSLSRSRETDRILVLI